MICPLHPFDASLELLIVVLYGLLDGFEVGLVEALRDGVGDLPLGPGEACGAKPVPEEVVIRNRVTQLLLC